MSIMSFTIVKKNCITFSPAVKIKGFGDITSAKVIFNSGSFDISRETRVKLIGAILTKNCKEITSLAQTPEGALNLVDNEITIIQFSNKNSADPFTFSDIALLSDSKDVISIVVNQIAMSCLTLDFRRDTHQLLIEAICEKNAQAPNTREDTIEERVKYFIKNNKAAPSFSKFKLFQLAILSRDRNKYLEEVSKFIKIQALLNQILDYLLYSEETMNALLLPPAEPLKVPRHPPRKPSLTPPKDPPRRASLIPPQHPPRKASLKPPIAR